MKFLFFLERELHLPVLTGVMSEIYHRGLGEIAVTSVSYHPSDEGVPGRGLRPEVLQREMPVPFKLVENAYEYQPDITFLADFSYQFVEGLGTLVNVGHGTICKGWYFSRSRISRRENCADLLCVPGEVHKRVLQEQVYIPIAVTGMPKLDGLFRQQYQREEVLREMHLDPARKTVLFAPTFNSELSIIPHIKADLREYIGTEYNLMIKLHGAAPEEWKTAYRKLAQSFPNTAYSESPDIAPAFAAADVMISDVSSVIYEFLATNKPVVLFDSPTGRDYYNYREDDLEYVWRDVGARFGDLRQLPKVLERALANPVPPGIQAVAADFISVRDGTSAQRIVDAALRVHREATLRGTIVLHGNTPVVLQRWRILYQRHYTVITAGPAGSGADITVPAQATPFEVLQLAMPSIPSDPVFFIDTGIELSPLLIPLLTAHLHSRSDVGMIFPLVEDSDNFDPHQLRNYIRLNDNVPKEAIGWQLTYSLTGEGCDTEHFTMPLFGFRKIIWNTSAPLTDPSNAVLSRVELLRKTYLSGHKAFLAFDAYLGRSTQIRPQTAPQVQPANEPSPTNIAPAPVGNEEQDLIREIEQDPSDTERVKTLIRFLFEHEKYELVDVYEAMIPPDPEIQYYACVALDKQGYSEQAWNKISRIDTLAVDDHDLLSRILTQKGRFLLKQQHYTEAQHCLQEALYLMPNASEAMAHLGAMHMMQNDSDNALLWFEKAIRVNPNNVQALQGLGLIHQNAERFELAEAHYLDLLKLQPTHLNALRGLLTCAYRTHHWAPLIRALNAYLAVKRDDTQIRFVQAGVLFEAGRYQDAKLAADKLQAQQPGFPGLAELQEKLARCNL